MGDEAGVLMRLLSWSLVFQQICPCSQDTLVETGKGLNFSSELTKKETEHLWELGLRRNGETAETIGKAS